MEECLVNQAKDMYTKWPRELPTPSSTCVPSLLRGCDCAMIVHAHLSPAQTLSVALLARHGPNSLLIHTVVRQLVLCPVCSAGPVCIQMVQHLCLKHTNICAAGVENLVLPLGKSSTNEEIRPWRVAIGKVLSQGTITKLQLPCIVSDFSAAIKKYAQNHYFSVPFRNN